VDCKSLFRHCFNELTGFSACVASIIRVPYIVRVSLIDPSWSDVYGAIWSIVELTMGIVSACLPTLPPLYMHIFRRPVSGVSGSRTHDKSSTSKYEGIKLRYLEMPDTEHKTNWKISEGKDRERGIV